VPTVKKTVAPATGKPLINSTRPTSDIKRTGLFDVVDGARESGTPVVDDDDARSTQ